MTFALAGSVSVVSCSVSLPVFPLLSLVVSLVGWVLVVSPVSGVLDPVSSGSADLEFVVAAVQAIRRPGFLLI